MKNYQGYYMTNEIETKDDALKLIIGIALDYDGYREAEDLMELIDELKEIAKTGLKRSKWEYSEIFI